MLKFTHLIPQELIILGSFTGLGWFDGVSIAVVFLYKLKIKKKERVGGGGGGHFSFRLTSPFEFLLLVYRCVLILYLGVGRHMNIVRANNKQMGTFIYIIFFFSSTLIISEREGGFFTIIMW